MTLKLDRSDCARCCLLAPPCGFCSKMSESTGGRPGTDRREQSERAERGRSL